MHVGGTATIATDARVLAPQPEAGGDGSPEAVSRRLVLPPERGDARSAALAAAGGDILLLAEHFLGDFCRRARRKRPEISAAARQRLTEHPWPGNVRELRNLIKRLAYLSQWRSRGG